MGFAGAGKENTRAEYQAVIRQDGNIFKTIPLQSSAAGKDIAPQVQRLEITAPKGGHNTVVIDGMQVYMEHADCPDKICVAAGKLTVPMGSSSVDEQKSIACVPHGLLISIERTAK